VANAPVSSELDHQLDAARRPARRDDAEGRRLSGAELAEGSAAPARSGAVDYLLKFLQSGAAADEHAAAGVSPARAELSGGRMGACPFRAGSRRCLYDVFTTGDGSLCFFVGDVSGKGMPAALFMARTKTLIRIATELGSPMSFVPASSNAHHPTE
jgi:hypothetical protein